VPPRPAVPPAGTHSLETLVKASIEQRGVMTFLVVLGVIAAVFGLYAADRVIKARVQTRRVRRMSKRLAAVTARAEEQQVRREAAGVASAALTSVVPAIKHPSLGVPGEEDGEAAAAS
jgi:hypothetical protein